MWPCPVISLHECLILELYDLRMPDHRSSDFRTYNLGGTGGNLVCGKPVEAMSPCRSSRLAEVFDHALQHTNNTVPVRFPRVNSSEIKVGHSRTSADA